MIKKIAACLFLCALSMISVNTAVTQTIKPTDLEKRKADAQARKAEAQARVAEAQAKSAEAKARKDELANRQAELNLLAAKTTVSGDLIENDISAYKAVSCAASEISQNIRRLSSRIDVLMVYSPEFAYTMAKYSVLMNQLELLKTRYDKVFGNVRNEPPVSPGRIVDDKDIRGMASVISPANQIKALTVDMLALFKTDVKITGKTVVIGKDEFIGKVLNGLNVEVYYPEKMIPIEARTSSKLLLIINDLAELRIRSQRVLTANAGSSGISQEVVARLEALNSIHDSVINQFFLAQESENEVRRKGKRIGANDESYRNGTLIDYVRAELAFEIMAKKDQRQKYWLDVHVTKAGSNQRNKNNAVFDVFTGGKRMSFSGGAIVNYRIFNSRGRMLASDTILTYMPFKRSKKIAGYQCLNVNTIP